MSQGSSVESFLAARLQLQCGVTVLFGLVKAIHFQEADGSGEEKRREEKKELQEAAWIIVTWQPFSSDVTLRVENSNSGIMLCCCVPG